VVIVAARIARWRRAIRSLVSEAVRVLAGLPRGIGYMRYGGALKGWPQLQHLVRAMERAGAARIRKLRRTPPFVYWRSFVLISIAGGVIGGLMLRRGRGGASAIGHAAPQQLAISYKARSLARIVGGDCRPGSGHTGFSDW
jgi:hypothetical protein